MTGNQRNAILVRWVKSCKTEAQLNNLLDFMRKSNPFVRSIIFYLYDPIGKEVKKKIEEIKLNIV